MQKLDRYGIDCRNQSHGVHTIQIPPPKLLVIDTSPSATPKDIVSENLSCPECRHVYAYTAQDVHQRLFRIADRDLVPNPPICISVEFLCGEKGCITPLKVHVVTYGRENRTFVIAQLQHATFHISCRTGHAPHFDAANLVHIDEIGPFAPF
jgi:hypothetical protein